MLKHSLRFGVYILGAMLAFMIINLAIHTKASSLQVSELAEPYTYTSVKDQQRQLLCMTQNIYYEAASEPPEGKLAVAQIVMNRVASGRFGDSPCQVIFQKNIVYTKVICQFSWYCENAANTKVIRKDLWRESADAAKVVLIEGFRLPSLKNALYYHADYVQPGWNKERVIQIGHHIFYGDKS